MIMGIIFMELFVEVFIVIFILPFMVLFIVFFSVALLFQPWQITPTLAALEV
jgi:hypothetical protein